MPCWYVGTRYSDELIAFVLHAEERCNLKMGHEVAIKCWYFCTEPDGVTIEGTVRELHSHHYEKPRPHTGSIHVGWVPCHHDRSARDGGGGVK